MVLPVGNFAIGASILLSLRGLKAHTLGNSRYSPEKRDSANAGRSRQIELASSQLRVKICRAACQKPGPLKGLGFWV